MIGPRYLGDGVYAAVDAEDPFRIIVTTGSHNPEVADNVVYLEPEPMRQLQQFIRECFTAWGIKAKNT